MREKQTKYQEVINYIEDLVDKGELCSGDKLFSENELMSMFHISRQTVRRAIGMLEEQGSVRRIRGSGTYLSYNRRENLEKQKRIAVVTTYVDSYIFPSTIQGIESYLFERGYSVQLSFTNNMLDREKSVLEDIINRDDVAGLIVEGTKSGLPNPNLYLYKKLMNRKVPIVFINTYYPELKLPHVSLNDVQAARLAVKYLIDKGHRDIGAVLKLDDGQGRLRYLGYLQAMEEAGCPVADSNLVWIDTEEEKRLFWCREKLLKQAESHSAFFCYNDKVAFQLIQLLIGNGIKVPEQVAVIGVDDSELATYGGIKITSLPHPKEKLGAKAAELLCSIIEGKNITTGYEFDTHVVERASTRGKV